MSQMLVRDLMTTDLFTLRADEHFGSAGEMLGLKHVRHLPVLDMGKLVGLVTQRDLMRAQARLMLELVKADPKGSDERVLTVYVKDFMTKDGLVTCGPATPADDAARLMLDRKLGCVLVTDEGELKGILTEADIVKWAVEMMAKVRLEQAARTGPTDS
ncbi:MAG: CBS domain-containing protein [Deltaproteobacteria bacterium]|nr:CBS domain-containing protein [Deltaproteobacteria bacterium]